MSEKLSNKDMGDQSINGSNTRAMAVSREAAHKELEISYEQAYKMSNSELLEALDAKRAEEAEKAKAAKSIENEAIYSEKDMIEARSELVDLVNDGEFGPDTDVTVLAKLTDKQIVSLIEKYTDPNYQHDTTLLAAALKEVLGQKEAAEGSVKDTPEGNDGDDGSDGEKSDEASDDDEEGDKADPDADTLVMNGGAVEIDSKLNQLNLPQSFVSKAFSRGYSKFINSATGIAAIDFANKFKSKAEDSKEKGNKGRYALYTFIGAAGITGMAMIASKLGAFGSDEIVDQFGGGASGPTGASSSTGETGGASYEPEADQAPDADKPVDQDANYNRYEQNKRDRMSTEGLFDGTDRSPAELDQHVLEKIQNNPSLMAAVMEVRESGNLDKNFSLDDVNNSTSEFSVHGEHGEYSPEGQDAVEDLEESWEKGPQGRLLSDSEVSKIQEKYHLINHGTDAGEFKNAIDNKTYAAGEYDYNPKGGDRIFEKELDNGEKVLVKTNDRDPREDCSNILTKVEKGQDIPSGGTPGEFTPGGDLDGPDGPDGGTPPGPDEPNDEKEDVYVDDNGDVRADGPGKDETQEPAGGQNSDQANDQSGGGTGGSTLPSQGAEQVPNPSNEASQGASGETSNGNVNED